MQDAATILKTIWKKHEAYPVVRSMLGKGRPVSLSGVPMLARAAFMANLFGDLPHAMLLLTATEEEASLFYENLKPFLAEQVVLFPVLELFPSEVYAHNMELRTARLRILSRLCRGEKLVVVACVNAVVRKLAPVDVFARMHLSVELGEVWDLDALARRLTEMGYERVALTEIPGTFSMRGSLVDVFPVQTDQPVRIEFFDDEIETIRFFDPETQRSGEAVPSLSLPPGRELPLTAEAWWEAECALREEYRKTYENLHGPSKKELENHYAALLEYLPQHVWSTGMEAQLCNFYPQASSLFDYMEDSVLLLSEPEQILQTATELTEDRYARYSDLLQMGSLLPSFFENFIDAEYLRKTCSMHEQLLFCQLGAPTGMVAPNCDYMVLGRPLSSYVQNPSSFVDDMNQFARDNYTILLTASSDVRLARMQEILRENGCPPALLLKAPFTEGFESRDLQLAVITEKELFSRQSKTRRRRRHHDGEKIAHFMDLRVGDYVVHVTQGIGRYMGVERLTIGDTARDYLLIQYAGEDKLYLPVDQLDLIQKYVGSDADSPKLYRLGGGEWGRVKAKVRAAVKQMAEELIRLYSAREQATGYAFSADNEWQQEFEDAFPYAETPDQLTAAEEIKRDMESAKIMDRLLCGDVGFGKTEIALRAAYKAVLDSKQVAILVPTTVLAQQHYRTMVDRFSSFPVKVGVLSRFSSPKEQKETLKRLQDGTLDIVVGTHRLLSSDVKFHDLGLLIIDEEQRFGVTHKEKIKALKTQVDVLTLSATPIPRTLHMALVGMRDMSIISTPPEARFPVQTYVVEYYDGLLRDAIAREMSRGGQVYLVNNRVQNIYEVAEKVQQLLPNCRVLVGHGQMKERELEQVMMDFVAGEADVLVCTTIIENGLDIPNANTMIVLDADMFGLSQLYQLRGRVGRAQRQAFAYFTYSRDRFLTDVAKKRLVAIRDFTELGAGFKIAMRDLEIRGAGNILGPEQHGHIAAVGFDLYCKLLEEEMNRAYGQQTVSLEFTTQIDLNLSAFIPDTFVEDAVLKVEIYQRLAGTRSLKEISDLRLELLDRYGVLPATVENLLLVGKIKVLGRKLAIQSVIQKPNTIDVTFDELHPSTGDHFFALFDKWGKHLLFSEKKGFKMMLKTQDIKDDKLCAETLVAVLKDLAKQL